MKSSDLIFRFLIAVFFSLLVMLLDSLSWLGWFRGGVETVFRPETRILSLAAGNINRSVAAVRYVFSGPARIADLERRLAAAEREAISAVRLREKTDLSSVLDWADERGFSLIPVQVLSSGSQLIIEIPSSFPDLVGKPVLSAGGGLVGSVGGVGRFNARVKLLSDSASQIPAAVLGSEHQKLTKGILVGSFGVSLTLEKILTEVELQPDLTVVTTGEDDKFPPDLLIGWIGKNTVKEVSSVYQRVEVVPAAKLTELKVVFIIEPLKH